MSRAIFSALLAILLGYLVGAIGGKYHRAGSSIPDDQGHEDHSSSDDTFEIVVSGLSSADSIASISELAGVGSYERLALWLLDASAEEMQKFWALNSKLPDLNDALLELIFVNWARIDLDAALAENVESYAWRGWACHDPKAALDAALARFETEESEENNGILSAVVWAIGNYQPDWLRQNLDKIPEGLRNDAVESFSRSGASEDPRESIGFLRSQGYPIQLPHLTPLMRENPIEAYELSISLTRDVRRVADRGSLPSKLIDSLTYEDSETLAQLAMVVNAPELKLRIQRKQFEGLLESDPETAAEQVKIMPDGWAKQDMLSLIAKKSLKEDPQKSIELVGEIFRDDNDALNRTTWINSEGGGTGLARSNQDLAEVVKGLMTENADDLMREFSAPDQDPTDEQLHILSRIGEVWANMDLPQYAAWAAKQGAPKIYQNSARKVVSHLVDQSNFEEAIDWAVSLSSEEFEGDPTRLASVYGDWLDHDAEAARRWKESAKLDQPAQNLLNLKERFAPASK